MFGYVRPRRNLLSSEELSKYEGVYCGLCHTLGREYGAASRMLLNYDFAFLAMLLAPKGEPEDIARKRCVLHPLHGKPSCGKEDWLDIAAGESVILSYWKLWDTMADEGVLAQTGARGGLVLLKPAYQQARERYTTFDTQVQKFLQELQELEKDNCPSIDQTADRFARLLQAAAPETEDRWRGRVQEQLLYHLGRWVYLIDAVDDLPEDREKGHYNPILFRFPAWTQEDQQYLRQTMDHSLALTRAAFQLLDVNAWSAVIENILYFGLPGIEELVFSGEWREHKKKYRRNDP